MEGSIMGRKRKLLFGISGAALIVLLLVASITGGGNDGLGTTMGGGMMGGGFGGMLFWAMVIALLVMPFTWVRTQRQLRSPGSQPRPTGRPAERGLRATMHRSGHDNHDT